MIDAQEEMAAAQAQAKIAASVFDAEPVVDDLELAHNPLNDFGNAKRLVGRFGRGLAYINNVGWHFYDGVRWDGSEGKNAATHAAHDTLIAMKDECSALVKNNLDSGPLFKFSIRSGDHGRISGMIKQAASMLFRDTAEFDCDPWKFNCLNGTLDLDSLRNPQKPLMLPHRRSDLITKVAPVEYDPQAECPQWRAFLDSILPNAAIANFLQRWLGYCLTGRITEQHLVIFHGRGANGKSTIFDVIGHVMGDYAMTIDFSSLLYDEYKRGGTATPDLARLPGARFVVTSEPEVGARFSESQIKIMTGGDRMTVRMLHQAPFEFTPSFKLNLACNVKPDVRGQDEGIWRRMLLVPFNVEIPPERRDINLKFKLRQEASGILNWLLDGLRSYFEQGLQPPQEVIVAVQNYRSDNDRLGAFIETCVKKEPGARINARKLYTAYTLWCEDNAADAVSSNAFGRMLLERGYEREKAGLVFYKNIGLDEDMLQRVEAASGHAGAGG